MPSKLRKTDGTFVLAGTLAAGSVQGAAVADPAALTATNPTAPSAYAAVVNMTDPVTKAEGEAVSAALATLRSEVAAHELVLSAAVVDLGVLRTSLIALITSLETAGVIDT